MAFIGPSPAFWNDGKPGELSLIFMLTLTQSFLMQHVTCELMLCHATKDKYNPLGNKLAVAQAVSSLMVAALWIVAPAFYEKHVNLCTVLGIQLGLTVLCQWHFLLNTVSELAHALNISVLKVKDKSVALGKPVDKPAIKEALLQKS